MVTRGNLRLLVVAVACLLVAWTGPALAHGVHATFAHDADKIDGLHADSLVTEQEYDERPGTRLLAAGVVRADGTKDTASGRLDGRQES